MVVAVKNICIFMIIAQAILLLVPGSAYRKYVKVLVGILMILMISGSLLTWFRGGEDLLAEQALQEFEAGIPEMTGIWEDEKSDMGIYDGVERELKAKLNTGVKEQKYLVQEVELKGKEKDGEMTVESILITVGMQEQNDTIRIETVKLGESSMLSKEESYRLKQEYGECLGIDPERIEISVNYG
jgi:hypothetical protein